MSILRTSRTATALIAFLSVATAAADTPPIAVPKDASWSLRLPKDDKVNYRGVINLDSAGVGNTQMAYPAPNALVFLAAIFTHGAVVESQKQSQKSKLQEEADKVLTPYAAILQNYTSKELLERSLQLTTIVSNKKLLAPADRSTGDWLIESVPTFSLTQDHSAIVLENAVALYSPNATTPVYQNAVKVVSQRQEAADLTNFWSADAGARLKEESARLFAHSLDITVGEAAEPSGNDNRQKTFRYMEGGSEKMERAQLINEQCDRVIIKTLRGWLMSVPTSNGSCTSAAENAGSK